MPASEFRFRIIAQDKSEEAAKKVEARYAKLGKRLDLFGRTLDRMGVRTPFDRFGKGFDDLGRLSGEAVKGLAGSEEEIGSVAAIAGEAIPVIGGLAIATGAVAVAAGDMALKYNLAGASIERASRLVGDSASDLQRWRGAAAYAGVSAQAMDGALQGLGQTMQDAVAGRNQTALYMMNKFGIQLHHNADGSVDTTRAMLDLARAMDTVHGAQKRALLAQIFGVSPALPLLIQGSAQVADNLKRFDATGALQGNTKAAEDFQKRITDLDNHWRALRNDVAKVLTPPVGVFLGALDMMIRGVDKLFKGWDSLSHIVQRVAGLSLIAEGNLDAGLQILNEPDAAPPKSKPVPGAPPAARPARPAAKGASIWDQVEDFAGKTFEGFADRIEQIESGHRQFTRRGAPLVSPAGAVGAMQLEPETARAAAGRLGVPFSAERLATDASYNRQLGREELRYLLQRYGGDATLAAAAYNAGTGALEGHWNRSRTRWTPGWLQKIGDPRNGEVSDAQFAASIPYAETRKYVRGFVHAPRLIPTGEGGPGQVTVDELKGILAAPREVAGAGDVHHHRHVHQPPALSAPPTRLYAQAAPQAQGGVAPTPAAFTSGDDANAVRMAAPQKVLVEIVHRNAPRGTITRVQASGQVDVALRTEKALDLETAA